MRRFLLLAAAFALAACATVSETGRSQLILISPQQSAALGLSAFENIKQSMPVVRGTAEDAMVQRAGRRIASAVPSAADGDWEFVLFDDPTPNAFALPGGKVGVHTGLFQVAATEDQLAAVIGHEIAHVTARHSAERMSRDMVTQLGLGVLGATVDSPELVGLTATAATLGVTLPFTRSQESEADRIGLQYMAQAGYDPRAAVDLWTNFAAFGDNRQPEFLSTHPAPESRIERLRSLLPEAMAIYRARGSAPQQ